MTGGWPPEGGRRPGPYERPGDPTQRNPAQRADDATRRAQSSDYATGWADAFAWSQDETNRVEPYADQSDVAPQWSDAGDTAAPAKQWYQGWPIFLAAAGAVAVLAAGAGLAYTLTNNSTPSSPASIPNPPSTAIPALSSTAPSAETPIDTPPSGGESAPQEGGSNAGQGGPSPQQGGTVTVSTTTTVAATVTSTVTSPTLTSTVTSTVSSPTVTMTTTVAVIGPPTTVQLPR